MPLYELLASLESAPTKAPLRLPRTKRSPDGAPVPRSPPVFCPVRGFDAPAERPVRLLLEPPPKVRLPNELVVFDPLMLPN
jgi:hypothetical protein